MKEITVAVTERAYAVYVCTNTVCEDGEFASRIPPIYVEMPRCPCCGCPALLSEVLSPAS